jgi:hypothetical protein
MDVTLKDLVSTMQSLIMKFEEEKKEREKDKQKYEEEKQKYQSEYELRMTMEKKYLLLEQEFKCFREAHLVKKTIWKFLPVFMTIPVMCLFIKHEIFFFSRMENLSHYFVHIQK